MAIKIARREFIAHLAARWRLTARGRAQRQACRWLGLLTADGRLIGPRAL